MKVLIFCSVATLSLALPQQTVPTSCGTNERGVQRQEGDSWMVECNRCRCLSGDRAGCTRRFCAVPDLESKPGADAVVTETRNNNNNNNNDGVHFPGSGESERSAAVCRDSEGNEKQEGDSWKVDCNTCGCGPNGLAVCTQRFCVNIEDFPSISEKFLFAADESRDAANIVQCLQAGVEKCRPVTIDTEYTRSLKEGDYVKMIQDLNLEMQVRRVPEDKSKTRLSYSFMLTDGGEATLTVNTATGGVYGSVKPLTGDVHYYLEASGSSGSVLYQRPSNYFNQFQD